ncbi:LANO_0A00892g1_1 [Lachancea nothofagi CBS 11611]|uniref:LANO_0A00892g1_1 n=1 Tax=Lachancea nothofagi CBS 11611 TaxID=1266666 RepID=A0A1G4IM10_9SACH|nr:LANO_0A00892g1_1 [Lachancea nothofagi CBS 11611]
MVTFNCEVCNDTVPKKNTEKHYYRCPQAYYTCIDCNVTFDDGVSYKAHTQCISEDERYQGALYKGKKQKGKTQAKQPVKSDPQPTVKEEKPQSSEKESTKKAESKSKTKTETASRSLLTQKKGTSLYKILKSVKNKDEKKELLKKLVVEKDGHLVLQN